MAKCGDCKENKDFTILTWSYPLCPDCARKRGWEEPTEQKKNNDCRRKTSLHRYLLAKPLLFLLININR